MKKEDIFHDMVVQQGYVPATCTLDGQLVLLLVNKGNDPCAGCNMDRLVCKGRPKDINITLKGQA